VGMPPRTSYADSGGHAIAYQVIGDGPVDLVLVPGLISHLDLQWCDPIYSDTLLRLATFSRLIIMDQRGAGLSDSCITIPTVDERVDDLAAVIDAVTDGPVYLIGHCNGGPPTIVYSATRPERVAGLVLMSTFVKGASDEEHPAAIPPAGYSIAMEAIDRWGEGRSLALFNPSREEGRVYRQLYATFERAAVTKGMARAAFASMTDVDVTESLRTVQAPSLVMHCSNDFLTVDSGKYMAATIPDARFVELEGADHAPFSGAGARGVVEEVRRFVGERTDLQRDDLVRTPIERFGAVLMTDIVGSTEHNERLGDASWSELLLTHDVAVRDQLDGYHGENIKFRGDGYLASFSSCEQALRCAAALERVAANFGLDLRCAVHAGSFEPAGGEILGMTVNIAARLTDEAPPSAIMVSDVVVRAVAGSEFRFGPPRRLTLRGVPDPVTASLLFTDADLDSQPDDRWPRWRSEPNEDGPRPTPVDRLVTAFVRRFPDVARSLISPNRATSG
jgi:pimeloyl-ACP methyl ester carboxylesterase/class 3 adenylate cyclase